MAHGKQKLLLQLAVLGVWSSLSLLLSVPGTSAVSQHRDAVEFSGGQSHGFATSNDLDPEHEPGELPLLAYPKSLNDFYKGKWEVANLTGRPRDFKYTSGHIVFQVITRAHGREIKHIRNPARKGMDKDSKSENDSEEGKDDDKDAMAPSKEMIVVEEVDMVQVDMVIRDGHYSTPRDMHTYLRGIYYKSTGLLNLLTVCNSPDCGMYMFGDLKNGVKTPFFDPRNDANVSSTEIEAFGAQQGGYRSPQRPGMRPAYERYGGTKCIFKMMLQVEKRGLPKDDDKPRDPVKLYGNVTSDNCKISLSMNATAMNFEVYYSKAMHYTLMVTAAAFAQVLLLVRQIEYSNSRSSAVKVSLLTIGSQAILDSYLCLLHLTTGIVVEALFNAFATAAFFKFMIFSIFEMRYLLIIWKARRPQGFQEGWNSMRRELSMLYSRFYGCLLAGIVIMYQLQKYSGILVFFIYSFWVPQIVHNVQHDHRKPLLLRYVLGISATRLLIPLYALACPNNFLHSEPNYTLALALVCWVAAQVLVLVLQHYRGPRFFVPRRFRPEKYDYYRRIPMQPTAADCTDSSDCAICMMPVGGQGDPGPRVVTPCDHIFHQDCLKRWMEIKMECPVCRRQVPDMDEDY